MDAMGEIEQRAQAYVDGLRLETEEEFAAAVEEQLRKLPESNLYKRRATVLAMAQVGITIPTREEVFQRKETVGKRVFFDKQKGWYHDPAFREILEIVTRLYRRWSAGAAARQATAEFIQREAELREAEWKASRQMTDVVKQILESPLYEVETKDGEQTIILKPGRWTFDTAARLMEGASKFGRLSLNMTPGGRQEMDLNLRDALPPGVTPEQAEAVKLTLAKMLAASADGYDDDDGYDEDE